MHEESQFLAKYNQQTIKQFININIFNQYVYMSLFVDESNQNMLWELITKHQLFINAFSSSSLSVKQKWFKTNIQMMYDRIPQTINEKQLLEINRETLKMMTQKLHDILLFQKQIPNQTNKLNMNDFENKQQEYQSLLEIKKPAEINFSETIDDEKITNMEELIENQRRLRELDYQNSIPANENKLNILQDISTNELEVVSNNNEHVGIKEKKHVRFSDSNDEILEVLKRLDEKITKIYSKIFENETM